MTLMPIIFVLVISMLQKHLLDLLYIMALFKHEVINSNMRLSTLRSYYFKLGPWITEHANQKVMIIWLPQKRGAWMNGLFENVSQSQISFKCT